MSREKNIFEKFPQKWPKGVFARRVGGERGNIDLPSGAKGGEKMDLDRHDEHKQHAFDSFCKKVIRCEAYNAYRAIGRRQDLEIPFSQLPEEAMEALATWDVYPWEYTSFPVGGDVILIKDDRLADALTALPQRFPGFQRQIGTGDPHVCGHAPFKSTKCCGSLLISPSQKDFCEKSRQI